MKRLAAVVLIVAPVVAIAAVLWWFTTRAGPEGPDAVAEPSPTVSAPGIPPGAFELTVESVHDGDTLRAHIATPNDVVTDTESTRVRLLAIDTPEISPDLECWGAEATERLRELLPPGSTVWAAPDLDVLDQYGRHLLYLWTPDGRFVNGKLVAAGDATVLVYAPNDLHEPLLRQLEAAAAAEGRGLWGACG